MLNTATQKSNVFLHCGDVIVECVYTGVTAVPGFFNVYVHPPQMLDKTYYTDILSFSVTKFYLGKTAWRICWARDVLLLSLWLCAVRLDGTVQAASNGMFLSSNVTRLAPHNWLGTVPHGRCPNDLYTSPARLRPRSWSAHHLWRKVANCKWGLHLVCIQLETFAFSMCAWWTQQGSSWYKQKETIRMNMLHNHVPTFNCCVADMC